MGNTEIGATATISGTVRSGTSTGPVLAGVKVSITGGGYTTMTETGADGTYSAHVPAGSFAVTFTSPNYTTVALASVAAGSTTANANMTAGTTTIPIPDGTSIQTSGAAVAGMPRISGFSGPRLDHLNCAGGFAEVVLDDGTNTWSQQMDEIGGGTGDYFVKIPQVSAMGLVGKTLITITVTCPDASVDVTSFHVYIDPAGRVFDTNGLPVFAATVTLYRDNPSTGVVDFVVVPTGSAVMDPSINATNPDTTDGSGFFRWDLAPGTYKVTAEKAGCHAPGDPATLSVSTAPFSAATLNLRLTLECPPPPVPVTPDDNPEVAPGSECPSVGALDPFVDVPSTSFADKDVTCIFQLHVTTGTSATTYSPHDFVTREQMASFLARLYTALTGDAAPVVPTPFTDLGSASAFAVQDIARIYGLGVTTGTSATTYSPKDLVTREQMASFLARLFRSAGGSLV
jgi:hypothetical protein